MMRFNQSKDPTRTLSLRRRAASAIGGRFAKIRSAIRKEVVDKNVLNGTVIEEPETNAPRRKRKYRYGYAPLPETDFTAFLDSLVLLQLDLAEERPVEQYWLNTFIGAGYEAGIRNTRGTLKKEIQGIEELAGTLGADLPIESALTNPAHLERLGLIYSRTFNGMQGVSEETLLQMRAVLGQGIVNGDSPQEIAEALNGRVSSIGEVRSKLIARTEIVNAHQSASIQEVKNQQASFGTIEIKMQWQTTIDGRQRDEHRDWNNQIFTVEEAEARIGEPNCRCSLAPWLPEYADEEE